MNISLTRMDGLHVTEMDGEVLVYDPVRCKAHYLNSVTSRVWRLIDGKRTVDDIASVMENEDGLVNARAVVELALEQIDRRKLLQGEYARPNNAQRRSRRDLLKKLAAAAVALPAVMTMTAQPAWAQLSVPCTTDAQCEGRINLISSNPCIISRCINGRCVVQGNQPDGTVVNSGSVGCLPTPCNDCICQGGVPTNRPKPDGTIIATGVCSETICQSGIGVSRNRPDGTSCGVGMICLNGNCVPQITDGTTGDA